MSGGGRHGHRGLEDTALLKYSSIVLQARRPGKRPKSSSGVLTGRYLAHVVPCMKTQ